jgi:post-segregation antitoxin (ccd killing protein)
MTSSAHFITERNQGRPPRGGQGRRPGSAVNLVKLTAETVHRTGALVCIVRRMPRMQVYLPDDLYEQVKTRHLPASELLQEAVRAEVRRQDLLGETDTYLAGLLDEVGQPSPQEQARAQAIARRIASRRASRAS